MLLVWKDQFAVDNGVIDHDHKVLIDRINKVLQTLTAQPTAEELLKDFYSLRLHAEFHFKREEHLQALAGFPALAEHAAEHREMLAELDALLEELEALPSAAPVLDTRKKKAFLYYWFLHHLLDTDQMIKPYLEKLEGSHEAILERFSRSQKAG